MGSFSGLGIGLSFVFGCILMGLVAELYYLLWWKRRIIANSSISTNSSTISSREIDHQDFSFHFCWRNPTSLTNSVSHPQEQDLEMGSNKDSELIKGYNSHCEEDVELMRIHNLCGPPRFLFTIKEENKEDLESEDGGNNKSRKGSRTRSLSHDLVCAVDGGGTPFLTPLSSPTVKTSHQLDSYSNIHGFNPLFESFSEAELNRLRSSPPPKFKFLKDAEDKLLKRMLKNENLVSQEEKNDSLVKSVLREQFNNQASSQVIPLASSPTFLQQHSA